VVWPDGSVRWIEGTGQVTVGPDGVATGTIGCSRDVTARVETEHLLDEALGHARSAATRLERLQEVTADLAAALTVQDVVEVVRDHAQAAIGATSGAIVLPAQRGTALERAAFFGETGPQRDRFAVVPLDADVPAAVAARTGEPIYLSSREKLLAAYGDLGPVAAAMQIEALAVVPMLRAVGDLAGVLVLTCAEQREFLAEDRALLESVAGQCAVSLDRARLLEQSQWIAERLQVGLGLDDVPDVPGLDVGTAYRPGGDEAEHLGGDWFDVLPQPDGSVVLVIGDVMGRGIEAAATMTRVRSAIRAFASIDADPLVVLGKADVFAAQEWPEQFITVLYTRLDPADGAVTVASAGHLPALLLGDDDGVLLEIEGSPPLGLPQAARRARTARLEPGMSLLLVTDGLVERPGQDVYDGLAAVAGRARELLAGGAGARATVDHLVVEAGPAELADDITVVLVHRPGG
jgi:GAF domain-containing protein